MASSSVQPTPSSRPLCRFFLQNKCIYGQNCFFSHNQPQDNIPSASSSFTTTRFPHPLSPAPAPPPPITINAPSPSQQRIYCKFFVQGYCHRGASCWFLHESPTEEEEAGLVIDLENETIKSETTTVTATTATTATTTTITANAKSKEVVAEPDDPEDQDAAEERPCAICFEVPTTFGLLVSCDHIYCLECIREWRKNRTTNSTFSNLDRNAYRSNSPSSSTSSAAADLGPTKTCPLCRTPSPYIIPSSVFPATAHDKAVIIDRYKSSMSRIPCKYFERSDPSHRSCLFGNDCFFRHAEADAPETRIFVSRPPPRHGGSRRGYRGGYRGSTWRGRLPRFNDYLSNPSDGANDEFDLMVDLAAEALYSGSGGGSNGDDVSGGWSDWADSSSEEELARMLEMMMLGDFQAVEEAAVQRGIERAQAQREMEEWDGRGSVPTGRWFRMGDWGIYRAPETGRSGRRRGGGGTGRAMRRSYDVVGREEYEYGRIADDGYFP